MLRFRASCETMAIAWNTPAYNEHKLVLLAIADGCALAEIPTRCDITPESATHIVRDLEKAGLIALTEECVWFRSGSTWIDNSGRRRRDPRA